MTLRRKVLTGKRIRNAGTIFVGALIAGVPIAMAQDSTTIQTETTTTVQQQDQQQQRATDQAQNQRQDADRLQRSSDSDSAQLRAQSGELQLEADARAETSSQVQSNQNQRQQDQRVQYGAPESSDSVFTADMKDDGRQATVEGRVINIESYLKYGQEVALDRNDARSQIQDSSPVGLLTDDGKVIVLLSRDDGSFFAESQGASDAQLRQRFTQNEQQGQMTDSILQQQQRANEYNLRAQERLSNASELEAEPYEYRADTQRAPQQATQRYTQQTTTRYQQADRVAPVKRVGPLHHDPVAHRGPTEDMNADSNIDDATWVHTRESRSSIQQASPEDRSSTRYSADMSQSERKWSDKKWSDKDQSRQQAGSWQQDRQLSTTDVDSRASKDIIANSSSVSLDAHQRHMQNSQGDVQYSQGQQMQQGQQQVQWGSAEDQNRTQFRANRSNLSLQDRQSLQAGNRVSIDGRLYERQQEQGIVPQSIRPADQANMQNQNQRNQQNQLNQQNQRNQRNQQNQLNQQNQQNRTQTQINQSSLNRDQQLQTKTDADLKAGAEIDVDADRAGANLNADVDRAEPVRDVTQGKPQDSDLLQRRAQEAEDRARAAGENLNERATDAEAEVDAEVDTDGGM